MEKNLGVNLSNSDNDIECSKCKYCKGILTQQEELDIEAHFTCLQDIEAQKNMFKKKYNVFLLQPGIESLKKISIVKLIKNDHVREKNPLIMNCCTINKDDFSLEILEFLGFEIHKPIVLPSVNIDFDFFFYVIDGSNQSLWNESKIIFTETFLPLISENNGFIFLYNSHKMIFRDEFESFFKNFNVFSISSLNYNSIFKFTNFLFELIKNS